MRKLLSLVALTVPMTAAAQWTLDAELAGVYDDNVSRAQRPSDILEDRALTLRGALGRVFAVAEGDLSLRGEARGARYDNFSGLDHAALGIGADWRRKLGLGLTAPWLAIDGTLFREDYSEQVRDGRRGALSLALGKRFDERFEASVTANYDRRSQRGDFPTTQLSGRPFSLQGRSLSLKASYALGERALVFASAGTRRGDVVSSTRRNLQIFRESAAIANDPALGPDFIAYKLTGARTISYSVGLSWALGRRAALEAAVNTDRTRVRNDLNYDGNIYSLSFIYRY
jgi:hypothetical protein